MANNQNDISLTSTSTTPEILPEKSKKRYEKAYSNFMQWKEANNIDPLSEDIILRYLKELSLTFKAASLNASYSMLKTTLRIRHNIDISQYETVQAFVKESAEGYTSKKSEIYTSEQINRFLSEADDEDHLLTKVAIIIGITGCCKVSELLKLRVTDLEDKQTTILVTSNGRSFVISEDYYYFVKKYWDLRPETTQNPRFLINYLKGRCTKVVIGINQMAAIPRKVAEFLNLPNPQNYTGHALRRTSATLLIKSGANMKQLRHIGGWKSKSGAGGLIAELRPKHTVMQTAVGKELHEKISSDDDDDGDGDCVEEIMIDEPEQIVVSEAHRSQQDHENDFVFQNVKSCQLTISVRNVEDVGELHKNPGIVFNNCSNCSFKIYKFK